MREYDTVKHERSERTSPARKRFFQSHDSSYNGDDDGGFYILNYFTDNIRK